MASHDFIDYISKFQITSGVGIEDFMDRISFQFTVIILLVCSAVISLKQYILKSISCYISNDPGGMNLLDYVENYCWVHGTSTFRFDEHLPEQTEVWNEEKATRQIHYYQWIPFMMAIQCILFYLPRVFWQIICYSRTGTDLQHLVNSASEASRAPYAERELKVNQLALALADIFHKHREISSGKRAQITRKIYAFCNLFVMSKRFGTRLFMLYLLLKMAYLANAVGQLFLMERFLGMGKNYTLFGVGIAMDMAAGKSWEQTMVFPRVTYCHARVRNLGAINDVIGQCALPVNMLNERIYIFLWFWVLFVVCVTALSLPIWLQRIVPRDSRRRFVKKMLVMAQKKFDGQDTLKHMNRTSLSGFVRDYLRHDGVFLLRMISINAGDMITADIILTLWQMRDMDVSSEPQPSVEAEFVKAPIAYIS